MKNKTIIIGAGGVGQVVAHKCASLEIFGDIVLASRTLSKCQAIAQKLPRAIRCCAVDADSVTQLCQLFEKEKPFLVINVALPYQDLSIMEACLRCGCHYLDTANYEPPDTAKFEYHWQWDYEQRFKEANLMALLGSGFDPGVTNVFTAYAAQNYLDELQELNIIDVNASEHGLPFATNFNPEINIREISAPCRHWENGVFVETPSLAEKRSFTCPEKVGKVNVYRLYHEELESLSRFFPSLRYAAFWMSFSDNYLNHLQVIQNLGLASIEPISYQDQQIIPLQFLKALLPDPSSLAGRTVGKTCIGVQASGLYKGQKRHIYIYNICDHERCFQEVGSQAISYTTGVPAMIGAKLMFEGTWLKPGVWNLEQLSPAPFMQELNTHGLEWNVIELPYTGVTQL